MHHIPKTESAKHHCSHCFSSKTAGGSVTRIEHMHCLYRERMKGNRLKESEQEVPPSPRLQVLRKQDLATELSAQFCSCSSHASYVSLHRFQKHWVLQWLCSWKENTSSSSFYSASKLLLFVKSFLRRRCSVFSPSSWESEAYKLHHLILHLIHILLSCYLGLWSIIILHRPCIIITIISPRISINIFQVCLLLFLLQLIHLPRLVILFWVDIPSLYQKEF